MPSKEVAKVSVEVAESIQVKLIPSEDTRPSRIYSNFIQVAQTPYDFSIRFCDATPLWTTENTSGKMEHNIPIVAELAIPFALMPGLIKALETQYAMYRDKNQEKKRGKGN